MFVSARAAKQSRYSGSPILPCSLVLSKTAILLTVDGKTLFNHSLLNGLYKCTDTTPTS